MKKLRKFFETSISKRNFTADRMGALSDSETPKHDFSTCYVFFRFWNKTVDIADHLMISSDILSKFHSWSFWKNNSLMVTLKCNGHQNLIYEKICTGHIGITAPAKKCAPHSFRGFSQKNARTPTFSDSGISEKISAPLNAPKARKFSFFSVFSR